MLKICACGPGVEDCKHKPTLRETRGVGFVILRRVLKDHIRDKDPSKNNFWNHIMLSLELEHRISVPKAQHEPNILDKMIFGEKTLSMRPESLTGCVCGLLAPEIPASAASP